MGIIGLSKERWTETESKIGGFSLCPAGTGLLFVITSHREGVYTRKQGKNEGEEVPYVTLACSHIDDEGIKSDHWEMFNLDEQGIPFLKGFIEKIERFDIFEQDDSEWEELYNTAFTADIRHAKKKGTDEVQSRMQISTIKPVSHDNGEEIDGWQADVGLDAGDEEDKEERAKPATKKAAAKKAATKKPVTRQAALLPEEEEEAEEEEPEEGHDEDGVVDDAPPARPARRIRRGDRGK